MERRGTGHWDRILTVGRPERRNRPNGRCDSRVD